LTVGKHPSKIDKVKLKLLLYKKKLHMQFCQYLQEFVKIILDKY